MLEQIHETLQYCIIYFLPAAAASFCASVCYTCIITKLDVSSCHIEIVMISYLIYLSINTNAVAEIGFNQSVIEIVEGESNAALVCVQASGVMERGVTVYLETSSVYSDGMIIIEHDIVCKFYYAFLL